MLAGIIALLALTSACGAAGRHVLIGTARAPSTSGIVEVDDLDDTNTLVTVHLEHLHPPDRLGDKLVGYVVWFQGPVGAPVRAGSLVYDAEARTGDLSETAPMTQFTVTITAERDANAVAPSDFVVASQKISLD